MTRDEAIKELRNKLGNSEEWAAHWIDGYEALGMLKLDQPRGIKDKLYDAYAGYASLTPSGLLEQLDRVGLKLTEK